MRVTKIVPPEQSDKKYYVYVHKYPEGYFDEEDNDLSGVVFYVGKGKWTYKKRYIQRIDIHEAETRAGYRSRKNDAISAVWKSGKQICKEVVYETEVERDALIYEWAGINMIWAGVHLTNFTGNEYEYERRRQEEAEASAQWRLESEIRAKRTYTLSPEEQEILLQIAQEDGVTPSECLEQMIKSRGIVARRAS